MTGGMVLDFAVLKAVGVSNRTLLASLALQAVLVALAACTGGSDSASGPSRVATVEVTPRVGLALGGGEMDRFALAKLWWRGRKETGYRRHLSERFGEFIRSEIAKWAKAFENLKYIVIDELHYYRGVYGSHLANVMRRLLRPVPHSVSRSAAVSS